MPRFQYEKRGFTLVELLVVIAIIGILAGFITNGLVRAKEKAKIADAINSMRNLETIMVDYYTTHNTYPPAYGFLSKDAFSLSVDQRRGAVDLPDQSFALDIDDTDTNHDLDLFITESYMNQLGLHGNLDYYDPWALDSTDTDYDGTVSRLEYFPANGTNGQDGFDTLVSNYASNTSPKSAQRQFIYIPVNQRQFRRAKKYWDDNGGYPTVDNPTLQAMNFPPANYDAFILVSAGVVSNTQGLIYDLGLGAGNLNAASYEPNYAYHIAAMATYYILTRDGITGVGVGSTTDIGEGPDNVRDFDYGARETQDQAGWLENKFPAEQHGTASRPTVYGPIYRIMQ